MTTNKDVEDAIDSLGHTALEIKAQRDELLAALKIAYRSLSQYKVGDELCQIRAAIARAEGRQ